MFLAFFNGDIMTHNICGTTKSKQCKWQYCMSLSILFTHPIQKDRIWYKLIIQYEIYLQTVLHIIGFYYYYYFKIGTFLYFFNKSDPWFPLVLDEILNVLCRYEEIVLWNQFPSFSLAPWDAIQQSGGPHGVNGGSAAWSLLW